MSIWGKSWEREQRWKTDWQSRDPEAGDQDQVRDQYRDPENEDQGPEEGDLGPGHGPVKEDHEKVITIHEEIGVAEEIGAEEEIGVEEELITGQEVEEELASGPGEEEEAYFINLECHDLWIQMLISKVLSNI